MASTTRREWGTDLEITALSILFDVSIEIYMKPRGGSNLLTILNKRREDETRDVIRIINAGGTDEGTHYDYVNSPEESRQIYTPETAAALVTELAAEREKQLNPKNWSCAQCTLKNPADKKKCAVCNYKRPS